MSENVPEQIPASSASLERPHSSSYSSPTVTRRQMSSSSSRPFLARLFGVRDHPDVKNIQSFVSSEGSITQNAWNGMSQGSSTKVRLKTIETLQEVDSVFDSKMDSLT